MSVLSERVTCVEYRIDGTVADVVWWLSSSRAIELYGVLNRGPLMFKICAKRCDQCLFSPQRIVSKQRMADIVKGCRDTDNHFMCHKHDDMMCRGYFETQPPSQMLRIAGRLNAIVYVDSSGEPVATEV